MDSAHYFYAVFVITILVTRLFLYLRPQESPTLFGITLHHYLYGLLLIPVGIVLQSVLLYAIGLALFIDELTDIVLYFINRKNNYWGLSPYGTLILVAGMYFLKDYVVFF